MANELQKTDPVDIERRNANIRHIDHTMGLALMKPLEVWDEKHIGRRTMEYLGRVKRDDVRQEPDTGKPKCDPKRGSDGRIRDDRDDDGAENQPRNGHIPVEEPLRL